MSEDRAPLLSTGPVPPPAAPPPAYSPPGGVPAGAVPPSGAFAKPYPPAGGHYGTYAGPPGYQPAPTQQPTYLQPQTVIVTQPSVVIVGGCPACRVGVLEDDFTCLGVCCAILFFPLGLICCLLMREKRCPNCGAIFG